MEGWLVSHKDPDVASRQSGGVVYLTEAVAFREVSETVKNLSIAAMESLEGGSDFDEVRKNDVERLREILQLIADGKHEEAYVEWRAYADDVEPYEDVLIEEVEVVT